MNTENSLIDMIKLANKFITENPARGETEFMKFLFDIHPKLVNGRNFPNRKQAKYGFNYVKSMKGANINESEWKVNVYPDQNGKVNDVIKSEKRIAESLEDNTPKTKRRRMTSSFQDKEFTVFNEFFNYENLLPFSELIVDEMETKLASEKELTEPVLLFGPKKCGKTTFIRYIAQKYGYIYVYVSKYHIENMVKDNFEKAIEKLGEGTEKVLLHFELHIYSGKVVDNFNYEPIEASSRFLMIYEMINPGPVKRLTYWHITFPIVSNNDRQIYLEHFLSGYELEKELTFEKMAKSTPGYEIGEIKVLCNMLIINAKQGESVKGLITESAFIGLVKSNKIKHDYIDVDDVSWSDIGGHDEVKSKIENIMNDLLRKESGKTEGVILYGPPGCGKTMMARASANQLEFAFVDMNCAKILDKYQGESEKSVCAKFAEARSCQPSILFIDEIDALCSRRDDANQGSLNTIVNTFLVELDGITSNKNSKLLVIGATNCMDKIDPAIKRSGRLGRHIEVKIPECPQQRYNVLMACTKNGTNPQFGPCNLDMNNFSIENIFNEISEDKYTKEWNHSDLASMVREAETQMKTDKNNESQNCVTLKHMLEATKIKNLEKKYNNKISPEFDMFTKRIFIEEIENKVGNYEFNEENLTFIDEYITNNISKLTVGGRKFSGKSTLIEFTAKKYHFNLVKFNQKYFKNFDLEKFYLEINQFVQKNGPTLFQIDQRLLLRNVFTEIISTANSDNLISGGILMFETGNINENHISIPDFTKEELELHLQNCLQNRFVIEKSRIPEYLSMISNWTHNHFKDLHDIFRCISLRSEEFVLKSIKTVNALYM